MDAEPLRAASCEHPEGCQWNCLKYRAETETTNDPMPGVWRYTGRFLRQTICAQDDTCWALAREVYALQRHAKMLEARERWLAIRRPGGI